jgi:hypothetical protein
MIQVKSPGGDVMRSTDSTKPSAQEASFEHNQRIPIKALGCLVVVIRLRGA